MKRRESPYGVMSADVIGFCEGSENPYITGVLVEITRPLSKWDELYLLAHGARMLRRNDIVTHIPFEKTSPQALLRLARRSFIRDMSGNRIVPTPSLDWSKPQ